MDSAKVFWWLGPMYHKHSNFMGFRCDMYDCHKLTHDLQYQLLQEVSMPTRLLASSCAEVR